MKPRFGFGGLLLGVECAPSCLKYVIITAITLHSLSSLEGGPGPSPASTQTCRIPVAPMKFGEHRCPGCRGPKPTVDTRWAPTTPVLGECRVMVFDFWIIQARFVQSLNSRVNPVEINWEQNQTPSSHLEQALALQARSLQQRHDLGRKEKKERRQGVSEQLQSGGKANLLFSLATVNSKSNFVT